MIFSSKQIYWISLVTLSLLLVPLVAMRFTSEVVWDWQDFLVAGLLISTALFAFVFVSQQISTKTSKYLFGFGILVFLLLVWIQLAVGII